MKLKREDVVAILLLLPFALLMLWLLAEPASLPVGDAVKGLVR